MKILLILPNPYPGFVATRSVGKRPTSPPLNLPYLGALTPPDIEIEIVDETVATIDFDARVDMVGISVLTMAATRAYEISREFRKRGICVVMGGIHPTVLPEEACRNADAIVVGEAEDVWHPLVTDFREGRLKKIYQSQARPTLKNLPKPRWELVKRNSYLTTNIVQVSRGCPYKCAFCSIGRTFGRIPRYRPIADIIEEVQTLKGKLVGFVDADIVGHQGYAEQLFQALEPSKKFWACDAGISIANNERLLESAARSGCKILYIGFESLSRDGLRESGKLQNLGLNYKDSVEQLHQHGIMVSAGFIFGFDSDDKSVFERTVEFAIDSRVDLADFHILCPYPGTQVYAQLKRENRIFERDWSKYSKHNVVFYPKLMTPDDLFEGCHWAWRQFYSSNSILRRFFSPHHFKSWMDPFGFLAINLASTKETSHKVG